MTYDRVFELSKIAKEMLSAKKKEISIRDISALIFENQAERLGDITVRYARPINIHEYLQKNKFEILSV